MGSREGSFVPTREVLAFASAERHVTRIIKLPRVTAVRFFTRIIIVRPVNDRGHSSLLRFISDSVPIRALVMGAS